jgi:hypothetical protein
MTRRWQHTIADGHADDDLSAVIAVAGSHTAV